MRHLLSIADLSRDDVERLLDRAAAFEEVFGAECGSGSAHLGY